MDTVQLLKELGILQLLGLIFAVPIGLVVLLKLIGLNPKNFLQALKDHTAAELKIEERIQDLVHEIKNFAIVEHRNRQYLEGRMKDFSRKIDRIQHDLTVILTVVKKRKTDWIYEPPPDVVLQEKRGT